uniref:SAP domain-containing protein n=1 Tax=Onchocerca volvulus TaxID=6282 RepID=A0A8R1TLL5_ONCVO
MENKSEDLEIIQNHFATLKYSQLRKVAKQYAINANQKKEVLIMELSKVWNHHECNKENIAPKEIAESKMALSCSSKSSLNDTFNQTFSIERDSDNDMKPYTEKFIATNENSNEEENILLRTQKISFVPLNDSSSNPKIKQDKSTPCKSKSAEPGTIVARFAALHQKLVEKQPTLQEADANVKRKFAEHEKAVPNIFKRLATPKFSKKAKPEVGVAVETTGYKFKNVVEDPSKMNFLFSKLYGTKNAFATVQNNTNVDVKELTKRPNTKQVRRSPRLAKLIKHTNSVTVPQLSTRLQRLAIPKGKHPEVSETESEKKAVRRCGRRYVPYRRMIPYVDTTKMTDNQFHEAKMLGQIQTFTAVSSSRTEMRQQLRLKRNETRERIMKAKRGY